MGLVRSGRGPRWYGGARHSSVVEPDLDLHGRPPPGVEDLPAVHGANCSHERVPFGVLSVTVSGVLQAYRGCSPRRTRTTSSAALRRSATSEASEEKAMCGVTTTEG